MGYLDSFSIQSTIDSLNKGDRIYIEFESGTFLTTTITGWHWSPKFVINSHEFDLVPNGIKSIRVLERARPKLRRGDRFRLAKDDGMGSYVVLNVGATAVRAIGMGRWSEPFYLNDDDFLGLTKF